MANNQYINKVDYAGQTLIDLTSDTVSADKLRQGYTAHDKSGAPIIGSYVPGISVTESQDAHGGTIVNIVTSDACAAYWEGKNKEFVTDLVNTTIPLTDTSFASWTPTETATSILATHYASQTYSADPVNYDYLIKVLWKTDFAYGLGTPPVAKFERLYGEFYNFFTRRPSGYDNMQSNTYNAFVSEVIFSNYLGEYYDATGVLTSAILQSVSGIYVMSSSVGTVSSATSTTPTLTINIPAIYARCSGSTFSKSIASHIDTANTTITIKETLYRFPAGDSVRRQSIKELIDWYNAE